MRHVALLIGLLACDAGDSTDSDRDSGSETGSETSSGSGSDSWSGLQHRDAIWYTDVSGEDLDPRNDAVIADLSRHGWGLGRAQIDFSLVVLEADKDTPRREFIKTDAFYSPDCDHVPMPVPAGGRLEGETGYACEGDGDCHLLVVERDEGVLYEMWRADQRGDEFRGGCAVRWEMERNYGPDGRGQQCTSADAAGYPIAPLLVTADEVAAGNIGHALRFILPNSAIRAGEYVAPATHSTGAASGGPDAPPYGVRMRLRADYPVQDLPNDASQTVARALQKHGMFLADGGRVLFTFQSDWNSTAKWADLMGSRDLQVLQVTDFEVLSMGTPVPLTYDCVRR